MGLTTARMRRSAVVVAVLTAALTVQVLRANHAAATSCSFDANTHIVTATMTPNSTVADPVSLTRSGDTIWFGNQPCGTVFTVNTFNLDMANSAESLVIELS